MASTSVRNTGACVAGRLRRGSHQRLSNPFPSRLACHHEILAPGVQPGGHSKHRRGQGTHGFALVLGVARGELYDLRRCLSDFAQRPSASLLGAASVAPRPQSRLAGRRRPAPCNPRRGRARFDRPDRQDAPPRYGRPVPRHIPLPPILNGSPGLRTHGQRLYSGHIVRRMLSRPA
jgi:hypothetical protein